MDGHAPFRRGKTLEKEEEERTLAVLPYQQSHKFQAKQEIICLFTVLQENLRTGVMHVGRLVQLDE